MPCRDYQDDVSYNVRAEQVLKELCDRLTALLCEACSVLERDALLEDNEELTLWYKEHRKADLANMKNMLRELDVEELSKSDFDELDSLISRLFE